MTFGRNCMANTKDCSEIFGIRDGEVVIDNG